MNDKNMLRIIDSVIHPDVCEKIKAYSTYDSKRQYETILSFLCKYSRQFASEKNLNPYIQLMDDQNNFIFNKRLIIKIHGDPKFVGFTEEDFNVDIINDFNSNKILYVIVNYMTENGISMIFGGVDTSFKQSIEEITSQEYIKIAYTAVMDKVKILTKEGYEIRKLNGGYPLNLLLHKYRKETETWDIFPPHIKEV